jgi:hypothetical protein
VTLGVELVATAFDMDEEQMLKEVVGRKNERQVYTVSLIDEVLQHHSRTPEGKRRMRESFAKMMAFDSLVGANDRHAQNWGVVFNAFDNKVEPYFSPLFDTARGLFWNYSDAQLQAWDDRGIRQEQIEKYAKGSTPLIGVDGFDDPDHFDVIHYMVNHDNSGFADPIRGVFRAFPSRRCRDLVSKAVGRYFSRRRLEYIVRLLEFRYNELARICELP